MSVIDAGELDSTKKGNAETQIMNSEQKKVSWFSDLTSNIGIIHTLFICTVNIYMYKTIQARVNTVAIPTSGIYPTLYRELLKPLLVIYQ